MAGDVVPLHPDEHLFEAMLVGWRQQQLARNLSEATVEAQARLVRRFQEHCGQFPWQWLPGHLEEWTADLRSVHRLAHSTIRSYQMAVRRFLEYLCEPHPHPELCRRRVVAASLDVVDQLEIHS